MMSKTLLPNNLGIIHFIGIGGIGMSGIAEVLINLGYKVQGSDKKESLITQRLQGLGAKVSNSHSSKNLNKVEVVVISSAIKKNNPELVTARRLRLPVVRRAEMLAELMRLKSNIAVAGSHGKTTTTSMISTLLDGGSFDPTVINGGIIQAYGSNARLGAGDWMVVEADESDGTFTKLPATLAVITNINAEHMDHYVSFKNLEEAFYTFATNIPFYGAVICCTDDPNVHELVGKINDRKIIKYGFNKQADYRIDKLNFKNGKANFDIISEAEEFIIKAVTLPIAGEHNVLNALGAVVVARFLGIPGKIIKKSLSRFSGVKRRFTLVANFKGVKIIDDYGHHPVEIAAVLKAARQSTKGKVVAVHQPHRYTRLASLFDEFCKCFNEADVVAITEVYSANEDVIKGANRDCLVDGLRGYGHRSVHPIRGENDLAEFFKVHCNPGDIFVCLGAGSISSWVNELPAILAKDQVL